MLHPWNVAQQRTWTSELKDSNGYSQCCVHVAHGLAKLRLEHHIEHQ